MTDTKTDVARTPDKQVSWSGQYIDPFSAFRAEMDRLMDGFFGHDRLVVSPRMIAPLFGGGASGVMLPNMDVTEDEEKITVTAELPGMSEADVEVMLRDDLLVVKGEKRSGDSSEEDNVHVSERRFGSFHRALRLPNGIDADKIEAHVDKGVLMIIVPKKPEAVTPTREIPVGKG